MSNALVSAHCFKTPEKFLTTLWNVLAWNDLTMERSHRMPINYEKIV